MNDIIFDNVSLNKNTYYFLYVGEFKAYGINMFFKEFLEKKLSKEVDFIAIMPDVLEQYPYGNIIISNSKAKKFIEEHKQAVSVRINMNLFSEQISNSKRVNDLISYLVKKQGELYINVFENYHTLNFALPGVEIIGPKKELAHKLNNKINQIALLKETVPLPKIHVCKGLREVVDIFEKEKEIFKNGMFISMPYSAAGSNSAIVFSEEEILNRFHEKDSQYIISQYIPHKYDPTVLGVVINEESVYIAGVADQRIEERNKFTGSTYPSVLDVKIIRSLKEHTRNVGKVLAKVGYRGIFGCDFIVDNNDQIYFIEVNARKQGTTMEFCCTLENAFQNLAPNLPEIEFYAVKFSKPPNNMTEIDNFNILNWSTYNYKMKKDAKTCGFIPHFRFEREMFKNVIKFSKKEYAILEHIGDNMIIKKGGFLGRVISVSKKREDVIKGIEMGKSLIESTICKKEEV